MSIHARAQLFLIRPFMMRTMSREMPSIACRMHSMELAAPARLQRVSPRTTHIIAMSALLSAGIAALTKPVALCQPLNMVLAAVKDQSGNNNTGDGRRGSIKDEVDKLVDQMMSRCGEISVAGGLGFCSGYALKQVGKVAAITIGTLFIIAQVASTNGYIDIHWHKLEKDVIQAVDSDGDGKITPKDLKVWYKRLMKRLSQNIPSSAGFAGGFLFGLSCS